MAKAPDIAEQKNSRATNGEISRRSGRFFSLKWKIFALLSLVLGTVHTSLVYYNYQSLRSDFEDNVETNLNRYRDTLQQSLHRSGQRLQQIAGLLPGLVEVTARNVASADVWMSVQFELGLDLLVIYDESGQRIAGNVRSLGAGDEIPEILFKEIQEATLGERPESFILCLDTCMQYALVPFLSSDGKSNIITLATILSDVVLDFPRLTGADMALMVKSSTPTHWDMRPVAISRAPLNRPLLDELAAQVPIDQLLNGYNFERGEQTYRVQSLPLSDFNSRSDGRVLIYSDITRELGLIEKGVIQEFSIGMISLAVALLLVLWSLWGVIVRVSRLSTAMPNLAVSAFDDARNLIGYESVNPTKLTDEMDLLSEAALNLTDQLESLEHEVEVRAESLQKERDFNQQLLDTAPVIIMTQTTDGQIVHVNQFGEELLGWPIAELKNQSTKKLLADESEGERLQAQLKEFTATGQGQLEQTTKIRSNEGESREITWLHSVVDAQPRKMVLSVGLDVTERTEAEDRMRWLAEHDPLTELYNRRKLNQEFERGITLSEVNEFNASLFYIDLDGFNEINELCGHETADEVLREVSKVLRATSGEGEICGRIDSDEFAILIPQCIPAEAELRAENLCKAINEIDVSRLSIEAVTASIGVAHYPTHGESAKELFAHAETAKQVAKQGKRGLWKVYSEEQMGRQLAAHRVYWKTQIDQALAENRILVYYQPIMRVADNVISHYECLVRMESPVGKVISPSQFVEVAESSDQVHQIRDRVMRRAARYMRRHRKRVSNISIAINLSGNTFSDDSFMESVEEIIESSGIDPRNLIFEVTETAAVENMDNARRTLNQIKRMGCSIALDDFGVGFTSFEYLKQLPVDYVKLDQSFVRQLASSPADQTLVRSMIKMVQGLGKRTVAEGVEDYEQLEWLRKNHIDYIQGYLLGEPKADMLEVSDTPNPLAGHVSSQVARSA